LHKVHQTGNFTKLKVDIITNYENGLKIWKLENAGNVKANKFNLRNDCSQFSDQ